MVFVTNSNQHRYGIPLEDLENDYLVARTITLIIYMITMSSYLTIKKILNLLEGQEGNQDGLSFL